MNREEKERLYCSYGDTVHYADPPKWFTRCDGSFMYDEKDIPYLDLQMWYSTANFGYKNTRLSDALKKQIDTLPQIASQFLHQEKVDLAEAICKNIEARTGQKGRVHFNVGGAQSIEDSLKVVRMATKKNLMFAFQGSYHGRTLGATDITSSYRYRRPFGHFSNRAQFIPFPYTFRCPYDNKECCNLFCLKQFKKLFDTEYYSIWDPKAKECEFGAFYMEPIQGTGGYIIPPKGYFEELCAFLKEKKILIVADEVQMGFYRSGKMWSFEHFGITPDIVVFGKSLTNGLNPLSGLWARDELINPKVFPPGTTHSTFSSNPLGTAAGLAVMKMLQEKDYEKSVMEKGKYFLEKLKELKERWKMIGDVNGLGLALRAELCQVDGHSPNRELLSQMFNEGLKGDLIHNGKRYGLILNVGGYYKNTITFAPNLDISHEEIDLAMELLKQLLKRCHAQ